MGELINSFTKSIVYIAKVNNEGGIMVGLDNQLTEHELIYLHKIIKISLDGQIIQFGKLFSTKNNKYFYDSGTRKVICIDDDMFLIISLLFISDINDIDAFIKDNDIYIKSLQKFLELCITEKLFQDQDTTYFMRQYL